jgi:hypothetical protein
MLLKAKARQQPVKNHLYEDVGSFRLERCQTIAVKHQAALLLRRLGGHKPHVGSGDSLTDGFCV